MGDIKAIARALEVPASVLLDDAPSGEVEELLKKGVVERCTKKSQAALNMLRELVQEFEKISA